VQDSWCRGWHFSNQVSVGVVLTGVDVANVAYVANDADAAVMPTSLMSPMLPRG
jgi:hypothetical protein